MQSGLSYLFSHRIGSDLFFAVKGDDTLQICIKTFASAEFVYPKCSRAIVKRFHNVQVIQQLKEAK